MITSLAKLGLTQHIQIILDYQKGDVGFSPESSTVTVTLLFKPKNDKDETAIHPIQIEGTIAEVEAHLASDFNAQIEKVAGLLTNISDVEAELEKAKKEKEEEKKKPELKKPEPAKGKPVKPTKPAPVEPATKETKLADSKPIALTPAWKNKGETAAADPTPPLEPPDELASLFGEEPAMNTDGKEMK